MVVCTLEELMEDDDVLMGALDEPIETGLAIHVPAGPQTTAEQQVDIWTGERVPDTQHVKICGELQTAPTNKHPLLHSLGSLAGLHAEFALVEILVETIEAAEDEDERQLGGQIFPGRGLPFASQTSPQVPGNCADNFC